MFLYKLMMEALVFPLESCLLYLDVSQELVEKVSGTSFLLNPLLFLWDITYTQKKKRLLEAVH